MKPWTLTIIGLLLLPCALKAQTHTVAITVDDLPFASGYGPSYHTTQRALIQTNKEILDVFSRHHIPATGFVDRGDAEQIGTVASTKIFERWLQPGFDLGNHLYSHADANTDTVRPDNDCAPVANCFAQAEILPGFRITTLATQSRNTMQSQRFWLRMGTDWPLVPLTARITISTLA